VAPPNGGKGQDFSGNYYNMYNYQDWITLALASAHVDLCNQVKTSYPDDPFAGQAPYYSEVITIKDASGNPYNGTLTFSVPDLSNFNYTDYFNKGAVGFRNSDGSLTNL